MPSEAAMKAAELLDSDLLLVIERDYLNDVEESPDLEAEARLRKHSKYAAIFDQAADEKYRPLLEAVKELQDSIQHHITPSTICYTCRRKSDALAQALKGVVK